MITSAVVVERTGDKLLAGAALAEDQNADILSGNAADLFEDGTHRRSAPDDQIGIVDIVLRPFHQSRRSHQAANFARLVDDVDKLFGVERFDEVIKCASLHRFNCRRRGAVTGDENHQALGIGLSELLKNEQAVVVAKTNVEQHHIGHVFLQPLLGLLGIIRCNDINPFAFKDLLDAKADGWFVVDDK